ncbi:MAG: transcriptional regulator, partial [Lysinibacillus sp.]
HETAYKWLQSLSKRGYNGDAGFYFWLANAAYFSNHQQIAQNAWDKLIELDPSKVGMEPWVQHYLHPDYMPANDRDYIIGKLNGDTIAEKLVGCFVLNLSPHKQEILAHPKWVDVDSFNEIEKYALAYILGHTLTDNDPQQKVVIAAMDAAKLIVNRYEALNMFSKGCIEQAFMMVELALIEQQPIKNEKALAATADFIFNSLTGETVTKKEVAQAYEISVSTLTKYCNLYFELLSKVPTELLD